MVLYFGILIICYVLIVLFVLMIFEVDWKFDVRNFVMGMKLCINIYVLMIYMYLVVYIGVFVCYEKVSMVVLVWFFENGYFIMFILV